MSKVVGIDLGTGFSCISILEGNEPSILENAEGKRTTPSIVGFTKSGEILVGEAAKRQAITNAKNTIYNVKRLIGQSYKDVVDYVKTLPYKVIESKTGGCEIVVDFKGEEKHYTPEQISAMILQKLKTDAEAKLGYKVSDAVITVPAYFNSAQRQATKDAGTIAGLNVLRTVAEPTAAALAYGLAKDNDEVIAVMDCGCGTTDFSILELGDGVFEVKATDGDVNLGGTDWDQAIIDWLISEFKSETNIDLSNDSMAVQRLKEEAEKAKIALSSSMSIDINLPFITADATGPKHLNKTLTRAKFEQLSEGLIKRTAAPFNRLIKESGISVDKIDKLILVGGSTRMPMLIELAKKLTNKQPCKGINPDECVSAGASIQGSVLSGDASTDILLLDVTPLDVGICTSQDVFTTIIEKNTTIPCSKSQVFTTYADNQTAVTIQVATGGRARFHDNKMLGQFNLEGIAPAPRGLPQIEVTLSMDANSILKVTAKDKGTGKEQSITISNSSNLSKDEIEKMKADAELNAEADKKFKDLAEAKNRAEATVIAAEKALDEHKDKLSQELIDEIKSAIDKVKAETSDAGKLNTAVENLGKVLSKIGEAVYKDNNASANSNANSNSGFEVVDDEGK